MTYVDLTELQQRLVLNPLGTALAKEALCRGDAEDLREFVDDNPQLFDLERFERSVCETCGAYL